MEQEPIQKAKKKSGAQKKQAAKNRKLALAANPAEQEPVETKKRKREDETRPSLGQKPAQTQAQSALRKKHSKPKKQAPADASNDAMTVIIGGLPYSSTQATLSKDFGECGKIKKLNVPKDKETGNARGFAFLTFASNEGVEAALKFNGKDYNGRRLTARMAGDKPNGQKSGNADVKSGNADVAPKDESKSDLDVFVGGLPHNVTDKSLRRFLFSAGDIVSLKLPLNEEGEPRGYAFVTFKDATMVESALKLNGNGYGGKNVVVRRSSDKSAQGKGKDNAEKGSGKGQGGKDKGKGKGIEFTVFVQGLTYYTTETQLRDCFSKCGEIASLKLPMYDESQSRGFAFISYNDKQSVEEALKLDADTSMSYDDCYMSVQRAVDHEEATRKRDSRGENKAKA